MGAKAYATADAKLGFLGLGQMGGPMARNLANAGYSVIAYDPEPDRVDACVRAGAIPGGDAGDVVRRSDVVLTSLRSSAMLVNVARDALLPNVRPGHVFLDMGTTEAAETRLLAAEFSRHAAALLDCPVSGGSIGAEAGSLRIFVGGDRSEFERCRPILEVLGDAEHLAYCGPTGSGQIVKGVNQLMMGLVSAAYLEAVAYGVNGGASLDAIIKGVGGGEEDWRKTLGHFAGLAAKDKAHDVLIKFPELPYFLREAREQGFSMPLTEALFSFCEPGPRNWVDNMGRPRVSFWHQLTTKTGGQRAGDVRDDAGGMSNHGS